VLIAVGALAYLILIWFSGAFSNEERGQLTGFVRRRLHI